jgi:hypothetical protein
MRYPGGSAHEPRAGLLSSRGHGTCNGTENGKGRHVIIDVLRRLSELQHPPGSEGAQTAAEIIAGALQERGAGVRIEQERAHGTYWVPIGIECAAAVASSVLGRAPAGVGGALAAAAIADDLEIGRRPLRRALRQCTVANVVGEFGPETAEHTLVLHAHHDAARTGLVFHPAVAKLAARIGGEVIERIGGTPAPMWGAVAGSALLSLGAALGWPRARGLGIALCVGYALAMLNIACSPAVPGANDNLSGVAVLLALADALSVDPPGGYAWCCSAPDRRSRSSRGWSASRRVTSTACRGPRRRSYASRAWAPRS